MDRVADAPLLNRFRVVNADSTLGPVITQAVRASLEESSVLSFYAPSRVTDALERMQRPATSRLDLPLAQQMAQREGLNAIVDGEIDGIGGTFLLTLRLVTADSGRELAAYR